MSQDFDSIFASEGDGGGSAPTRERPRKKRHPWRTALIILLVLILLAIAGVSGYLFYLGRQWDKGTNQLTDEDVFGTTAPEVAGEGMNVLLMGSDSRSEDIDYTSATGFRSDTIMVAHIPDDDSGVQIVSIPRDSWVEIEGHGMGKINAASSYGGLPLATSTVSDFIGAPIHHMAIIDFEGFKALTDAVGGVDVNSEVEFDSHGYHYDEGMNHLNGDQALWFVRERHAFPDGDLQRVRNQQAFMEALMDEVISADTLSSPKKINDMITEFSPYVTVDAGFDASTLATTAFGLRNVREDDIDFFTAPISGTGTSSDGQEYLEVDEAGLADMQDAFANDTVDEYADDAAEEHL